MDILAQIELSSFMAYLGFPSRSKHDPRMWGREKKRRERESHKSVHSRKEDIEGKRGKKVVEGHEIELNHMDPT